jgi:polar amino acid transport system substrate-binding protein
MNPLAAVPEMLSCQENEGESHAHLNLPGEKMLRDSKVASKLRRDFGYCREHDDMSGYWRTNMTELTLEPGVLRVASAFPDPPFEVTIDGKKTGFDVELMRLICEDLDLARHQVEYAGDGFNGIFDGLADGSYDAVISGTTITPEREQVALFSDPYLEFDQALVVNVERDPQIKTIEDLHGRVVGIQVGNTSDLVARKLLAEGAIGNIKCYPYHGILTALDDLSAGNIGALIKLFPVVSWLVKERRELAVVQQIPTHEKLGIAFAKTNAGLCAGVNKSLANIKECGQFDALRRKWLDETQKG